MKSLSETQVTELLSDALNDMTLNSTMVLCGTFKSFLVLCDKADLDPLQCYELFDFWENDWDDDAIQAYPYL